jgi:RNA 3'-terminal phosphate cyclase (ATP)
MVKVDGSYGEGGGQVIRTSVSLAAITGQAVEIQKVRAGRAKPGLQRQHLVAVKAAAQICCAQLQGDRLESRELVFRPGSDVQGGVYRFDIGTAGSACLVAQTVLVPLLHAKQPSEVTIIGGTHNPLAPTADYLEHVYIPALRCFGAEVELSWTRAGFFPAGGGELRLNIRPSKLKPIGFGDVASKLDITAIATTSNLPEHVSERGLAKAKELLGAVSTRANVVPGESTGAAMAVVARHDHGFGGATILGSKGKPMEAVAEDVALAFKMWRASGAGVDEHLADQLVLPASLAGGQSEWTANEVTEHLRTVVWLVQKFLPVQAEVGYRVVLLSD